MVQFSGHATNQDLVSATRDFCDADSSSYPIAELTRNINSSYEELIADIIVADGAWEWDDTNYTDLPIGTGNLVSGQSTYSFASEYLEIFEIDILDTSNKYYKIKPFDPNVLGVSFEEWVGATASTPPNGRPEYYDKLGDTIRLDKSPTATHVTLTNGIKVRFRRTADLFTTTDTTQAAGLPSTHHILLAYMAAIPYCMKYKKDRVLLYQKKVDEMRKTLLRFYSNREKDVRRIMTMKKIDNGVSGYRGGQDGAPLRFY